MYINKDKLLEWLRNKRSMYDSDGQSVIGAIIEKVKSGAIDATDQDMLLDIKTRVELVELGRRKP